MKLYYHFRSPYSHKVMIALHEKQVAYTPVFVDFADPAARAAYQELTPLGKVPMLLLDDGWKVPESSIIIEYLDAHCGGPRLIPADADLARQTRFHDRLADLYACEPMTRLYFDGRKPGAERDVTAATAAHQRLDTIFTGFDKHLANGRTWLMGDQLTMADCALLPVLALGRTLHPYDRWKHLTAYANRGFERPSFRAVQSMIERHVAQAA